MSSDEGEEAPAAPAPDALLRGSVETADGKVTWSGKWGFGKEAHDRKDTGKFEYTSKAPAANW